MEDDLVLSQTAYDFSKKEDTIQTILLALLVFLVPTFLGKILSGVFGAQSVVATNSQLLIGSIVNSALVISALNLKGWKKIVLVTTMPSISTILSGYVFKSASVYMVWMTPAIWVGNFALVYAFKYIILEKKKNYFLATIIGIICKVTIIFGFFMILKAFNIFPEKIILNLQKAMSIIQLITATIGCIVSYGIYKIEQAKE